METCKTCKFWGTPGDDSEPLPHRLMALCEKTFIYNGLPEDETSLAFAWNEANEQQEEFCGALLTHQDFGCNQHQPAPDGEGLV